MNPNHRTKTILRINIIGILLALGIGAVGVQVVRVQLLQGEWLSMQAASRYRGAVTLSADRGDIYDIQGRKMAVSTQVGAIGVHPRRLQQPERYVAALSQVLDVNSQTLQTNLNSEKSFVWIKRQVNPRQMQAVRSLELEGLIFSHEQRRFYPHKTLASQVLGFCGVDGKGLEGLEFFYNQELQGTRASLDILRDALGRGFAGAASQRPLTRGHNLVLTIDATIQHITESALAQAVREYSAASGMALVMCPKTGAILAMAQYPTFNPNTYSAFDRSLWRNRAVTDVFEPGSTMKIFTAAAALESGTCSSGSLFYCEKGRYAIGRNTVRDVKPNEWLTLEQVIQRSSNIGAVKIGETIGNEALYNSLRAFGFGAKTDIDSPGEVSGSLAPFNRWTRIDAATIAFGQGLTVTAVQLAAATAAVANGGLLMRPYLVARISDAQGFSVGQVDPQVVRRVLSPETAERLNRILQTVATSEGTGRQAALPEYPVAGKTGTAQKVIDGRYHPSKYLSSFVGFVPANDPALVILTIVDEPQRQHYGGVVAAPVFRRIAEEILNYLNIAPVRAPRHLTAAVTCGSES